MTTHVSQFPEVQPGGSLILAWQVKDKNVLVVGGGEVSLPSSKLPKSALSHRSHTITSHRFFHSHAHPL